MALGFAADDERMQLGGVEVELGAEGEGIVELDAAQRVARRRHRRAGHGGRRRRRGAPGPGPGPGHPNGAVGIDHVVVTTPEFDRTAAALSDAGMPLRRVRDAGSFRQGFRRLGPAILELVEVPAAPPGPARFWGLVVIVEDLAALAERLGTQLGEVRPAVQPGRHIAPWRRARGLGPKVAFMDAEVEAMRAAVVGGWRRSGPACGRGGGSRRGRRGRLRGHARVARPSWVPRPTATASRCLSSCGCGAPRPASAAPTVPATLRSTRSATPPGSPAQRPHRGGAQRRHPVLDRPPRSEPRPGGAEPPGNGRAAISCSSSSTRTPT